MLEGRLRSFYQLWFADSVAEVLATCCTPNFVTFWGMIFGLLVPLFLYFDYPIIAIVSLFISGYLDTLDGTIARLTNNSTPFGMVFDVVSDRVVEFGVVFGLFLVDPAARGLSCILMLGAMIICLTSFTMVGKYVESYDEGGFFSSPGLIEHFETFLFFVAMMLFPDYFVYIAGAFIILVAWTGIMRIYEYFSDHSEREEEVPAEAVDED